MNSATISLDHIKTQEQATTILLLLTELLNMEFKIHASFETISATFPVETVQLFEDLCKVNTIDLKKKDQVISFAKKAKEILEQLPVIICTIAFTPATSTTELIHNQIKEVLQKPFLLAYELDPTIIAGIEFSINGKFCDYSAKKAAETALQKYL